MEYQDNIFESNSIDQVAKAYLLETTKWAKFLAILGFIVYGLAILGCLGMILGGTSIASSMPGFDMYSGIGLTGLGLIYLIIILICFYPTYCLYKFAVKTKEGLQNSNNASLTEGFKNQKNMYKFYGIFTIIMLVIYGIVIIFAIIAAAFV